MKKSCANCECDLSDESYYRVLDNFLQVKYFDSEEDNCFCSQECFCEFVTLELIEEDEKEPSCRVCGCTWFNACPGGCHWVEKDLCSHCVVVDNND